jgi:D-cysteine desulfhydrase
MIENDKKVQILNLFVKTATKKEGTSRREETFLKQENPRSFFAKAPDQRNACLCKAPSCFPIRKRSARDALVNAKRKKINRLFAAQHLDSPPHNAKQSPQPKEANVPTLFPSRIQFPNRLDLSHSPTPIKRLHRLSEKLGVEIWIKRDDFTGVLTTGNKVRKLEFLAAQAKHAGADTLITCGGIQSNHARATASVAAGLGMKSHLILRGEKPQNAEGNLLLDRILGADVTFVTPEEYQQRETIFARIEEEIKDQGRTPYSIPEGGSNATGAWGYIRAVEELRTQEKTLGLTFDSVVHAVGSGGTSAGFIAGKKMFGLGAHIYGVNVCDDREYFTKKILGIGQELQEQYRLPEITAEEINIVDGFVGRGYALNTPEELAQIVALARLEGVLLDPVYTGKAFIGMCQTLAQDKGFFGHRILFIHTGGLFGVFSKSEEFNQVL